MPGPELLKNFREHAQSHKTVRIIKGDVISLIIGMGSNMISTRTANITADAVIIATGRGLRKESIKGEEALVKARARYGAATIATTTASGELNTMRKNLGKIDTELATVSEKRANKRLQAEKFIHDAKKKSLASDAVFRANEIKNNAILARDAKATAAETAAVTKQSARVREQAATTVTNAIQKETAATKALTAANKDVRAAQTVVAGSQAALATAQRSWLAGLGVWLLAAGKSITRFLFSWGGLVTAVLAGAAAFVFFSNKIRLFDDNSGVRAIDLLTVSLHGLLNILSPVKDAAGEVVGVFDGVGIGLMNLLEMTVVFMDSFEKSFDDNTFAAVLSTIVFELGIFGINLGYALGKLAVNVVKGLALIALHLSLELVKLGAHILKGLWAIITKVVSGIYTLGKDVGSTVVTKIWEIVTSAAEKVSEFGGYVYDLFVGGITSAFDK